MVNFKASDFGYQLYSTNYFSDNYNHEIYIKFSNDAGMDKLYISVCTLINNQLVLQGYLYANMDKLTKTSEFIGMKVEQEFRNCNIASLLTSLWIDYCYNYGYDYLKTINKQKKPFLLYLLKNYGFEVLDKNLYDIRDDVISICKNYKENDNKKILLFKSLKHERAFRNTKVFKSDNYQIADSTDDLILLDKIIMPLQNASRNYVNYELLNELQAKSKTNLVLSRHKK